MNTTGCLDEHLNGDYRIATISNKIAGSIFALNQVKNILPLSNCILILYSLVRFLIEYRSSKTSENWNFTEIVRKVNTFLPLYSVNRNNCHCIHRRNLEIFKGACTFFCHLKRWMGVERYRIWRIGFTKITLVQWEGDNSQLDTGITCFVNETGNYFERIQFSTNSEGYSRRVHQATSEGVCRHLLHCQTEPQFSKKALFLERSKGGARTSNPLFFVLLQWVPCLTLHVQTTK